MLAVGRGGGVFGVVGGHRQHRLGELAHRPVVGRIADVVDLARGDAAGILQDRHQRRDAVGDVGEGALLAPAVDQLDRLAANDLAEELGDDARRSFLGREDRVEPRADPVEGPKERVVQPLLHAVAGDDAVEQLLRAGVDPARLVDRAVDQVRGLGVELAVGAHAVDLRGRREHEVLLVLDRGADDRQVGLEVELEHAQRLAHVGRGRGDRDQRQDHVALADVVFDPFLVDRDVALEEVHARMRRARRRADRTPCPCRRPPSRWSRGCAASGGGR